MKYICSFEYLPEEEKCIKYIFKILHPTCYFTYSAKRKAYRIHKTNNGKQNVNENTKIKPLLLPTDFITNEYERNLANQNILYYHKDLKNSEKFNQCKRNR